MRFVSRPVHIGRFDQLPAPARLGASARAFVGSDRHVRGRSRRRGRGRTVPHRRAIPAARCPAWLRYRWPAPNRRRSRGHGALPAGCRAGDQLRASSAANTGMRGEAACSAATRAADRCARCRPMRPRLRPTGLPVADQRRLTYCSAAPVTSVISGTSAIANAPFMVWNARSRDSSAWRGVACACASHWPTVSRCAPTSVSRISRNTPSTEAGVPSVSGANASAAVASTWHRLLRSIEIRQRTAGLARVERFFARADAIGSVPAGPSRSARDLTLSAQCGIELRQHLGGLFEQGDDRSATADASRRARG